MQERRGLSSYPHFILFESPYSNWGWNDQEQIDVPAPQAEADVLEENLDELFDEFRQYRAKTFEEKSQKSPPTTSATVIISALNQVNNLSFQFIRVGNAESPRKFYYIAGSHFGSTVIFDTNIGPNVRVRRSSGVHNWVSSVRSVLDDGLDSPAGPQQIKQYSQIAEFTRNALKNRSGTVKLEKLIVSK